jgi:hypothetical protein
MGQGDPGIQIGAAMANCQEGYWMVEGMMFQK